MRVFAVVVEKVVIFFQGFYSTVELFYWHFLGLGFHNCTMVSSELASPGLRICVRAIRACPIERPARVGVGDLMIVIPVAINITFAVEMLQN